MLHMWWLVRKKKKKLGSGFESGSGQANNFGSGHIPDPEHNTGNFDMEITMSLQLKVKPKARASNDTANYEILRLFRNMNYLKYWALTECTFHSIG